MLGEVKLLTLNKALLGRQPKHCDVFFFFYLLFIFVCSLVLALCFQV